MKTFSSRHQEKLTRSLGTLCESRRRTPGVSIYFSQAILSNTQGFVELTIKSMESILHTEVSRLWSKGLLTVFTESKAQYDPLEKGLVKVGRNLKVDDIVLWHVDEHGQPSIDAHRWRVAKLSFSVPLGVSDLKVGSEYCVWIRRKRKVLPFMLTKVDLASKVYSFRSLSTEIADLDVSLQNLVRHWL